MDENENGTRAGEPLSRPPETILHGTAVAFGRRGVLILGPSGSGKSGLALRLIAAGAGLVSDDRVRLVGTDTALSASAPAALSGLIEARGVGLLRLPTIAEAPLVLAVDLGEAPGSRLPRNRKIALLGHEVHLILGRDVPNLDAIITLLAQNGEVVS
jgi:HPr kinase/phosphorylase